MPETIKWVKAKCPECGRTYVHPEGYKPATCREFDCAHGHQHPELKKRRDN